MQIEVIEVENEIQQKQFVIHFVDIMIKIVEPGRIYWKMLRLDNCPGIKAEACTFGGQGDIPPKKFQTGGTEMPISPQKIYEKYLLLWCSISKIFSTFIGLYSYYYITLIYTYYYMKL